MRKGGKFIAIENPKRQQAPDRVDDFMRINQISVAATLLLCSTHFAHAEHMTQSQALKKALSCLVVRDDIKFVAMDAIGGKRCYSFDGDKQSLSILEDSGILASFQLHGWEQGKKVFDATQLRRIALDFARRGVPKQMVDKVRLRDEIPFNNGIEQGISFSYSLVEGENWLPQGFNVEVNQATGHVNHFSYFYREVLHPLPTIKFSRQKVIRT